MSTKKGSVDYCVRCEEYSSLLKVHFEGILSEDDTGSKSWLGLGSTIKKIVKDISSMDGGTLENLIYDCQICDKELPKIYTMMKYLEVMKNDWEELDGRARARAEGLESTKNWKELQYGDEEIYDAIRRANFTHGKRLK